MTWLTAKMGGMRRIINTDHIVLVMEDDDGKVWVKLRDYQIALPLDNYTFNDIWDILMESEK